MRTDDDDSEHIGWVEELWGNVWIRVGVIAAAVAMVSWAVRETAFITRPVLQALGTMALPLAIGFTVAYICSPLVELMRRFGINRVLGSLVLYSVLLAGGGLIVSMVIPAMIRQSTDLAERTLQDHWYLDRNRNERYDSGDRVLQLDDIDRGSFFEDRNNNGERDPGEPAYERDADLRVRYEPSLIKHTVSWVNERQHRLERLIGGGLDRRGQVFLLFYHQAVQPVTERLDTGLQVARESRLFTQWPAFLRQDPEGLPDLDVALDRELDWPRSWPQVLRSDYDTVHQDLSDDFTVEQRKGWRAVMRWYGRCFTFRHQELMAVWDAWSAGDELSATNGALPPALAAAEGPAAAFVREWFMQDRTLLLRSLRAFDRGEEPAGRRELTEEERQQAEALYDFMQEAADAELAYAEELVQRIVRGRDGGGNAFLRSLVDRVDGQVRSGLQTASAEVGSRIRDVFTNIAGLLGFTLDLILIPVYAFFLTLAMPRIRHTVRAYLPERNKVRTLRILHEIEKVVSAFFRGRLIVCLLCALLVWAGFAPLGVPYAGLFGLLIGLATAVPLSGLLFLVPACLLVMVEGGDGMVVRIALVVAVYTVVQGLEMTVFTPTIMGREVELHPVVLILALLFFGYLWGILGLILAVPIAASLRILLREFVLPRLRRMAALPPDSRRWARGADPGPTASPGETGEALADSTPGA